MGPYASPSNETSFSTTVPYLYNEITGVSKIRTIGDSLLLSGLVVTILELKSLTSGHMTIYNTTNCTFSFPWLTTVKSLAMSDNKGMVLPRSGLETLKSAESIHLNGYINTKSSTSVTTQRAPLLT